MINISVKNVGKAYKYYSSKWLRIIEKLSPIDIERHTKKWVLKNINFDINTGESIGILGINGSGKSTLLKLLSGITKPTKGHIEIHGKVTALLELGMGFHPDFSGQKNVLMSGLMMGYSRKLVHRLMPYITDFADIGDYIDQPVRIYSSGMQMRLAFALATASRPDILIMDEVLSVGDSRFQAKCYERIASFKKAGTTLLLVSHSPDDIVKRCERAIFLKNGVIEMDGPSRCVTNRYLNELFSKVSISRKNNTNNISAKKLEPFNNLTSINSHKDLFSTRYGYRKEEYRWGRGGAKIIDYAIKSDGKDFPLYIKSTSKMDLYYKVVFERDYNSIIPGILIKSLEGIFLYGTNPFLISNDYAPISVKAGEVKIFHFSFKANLNQGDYLLSFGISAENLKSKMLPLDRRYDAIILHIKRNTKFWGIIDLSSTFKSY